MARLSTFMPADLDRPYRLQLEGIQKIPDPALAKQQLSALNSAYWLLKTFHEERVRLEQGGMSPLKSVSALMPDDVLQSQPAAAQKAEKPPTIFALPIFMGRMALWPLRLCKAHIGNNAAANTTEPAPDVQATRPGYVFAPLVQALNPLWQPVWKLSQCIGRGVFAVCDDLGGRRQTAAVQSSQQAATETLKPQSGLERTCAAMWQHAGKVFALSGLLGMVSATGSLGQQLNTPAEAAGKGVGDFLAQKAQVELTLLAKHKPEQLVPKLQEYQRTADTLRAVFDNPQLPQAAVLLLGGMTTAASLAVMGHAEKSAERRAAEAGTPQLWRYAALQATDAQNG